MKICVAYKLNGQEVTTPPVGADRFEQCEPVFIDMPGWKESTVGVKTRDDCRRMHAAICAESRNCARPRSTSSARARIATRRSCCGIRSTDAGPAAPVSGQGPVVRSGRRGLRFERCTQGRSGLLGGPQALHL